MLVFQTQLLSRVQLWCSSMDLPTSHAHLPPIPLPLAASLYSLYQMEGKLSQFQELVALSPMACAIVTHTTFNPIADISEFLIISHRT